MHLLLVCSNMSSEEIVKSFTLRNQGTKVGRVISIVFDVSHKQLLSHWYPVTLEKGGVIPLQPIDLSI